MINRRSFLSAVAAATALLATKSLVAKSDDARESRRKSTKLPDPDLFQAGDFIWPKKAGDIIPYAASYAVSEAQAESEWRRDRDSYVASVRRNWAHASRGERDAVSLLDNMNYRDFLHIYFQNAPINHPELYGSTGSLYTGHVGIITETNKDPVVVEAIWGSIKKVRTIRYSQWLSERPNELVWHGRIKDASPAQRESIAQTALKYENRPYNFWNFNLGDRSSFYCSKLVWLSTWEALHLAIDGNNDPDRSIWFSPKQLMKASTVFLLNDPANYGGGV